MDRYNAASHKVICDYRAGDPRYHDDDSSPWNDINSELYRLADEVLRSPVKTLADLGLAAQAYALANHHKWDSGSENEQEQEARLVVDGVCNLLGIEPLPGLQVVPIDMFDRDDEDVSS